MISLNNNINQIFGKIIPIGLILFGVSSCSVSQNTAHESDGIYYDPSAEPARTTTVAKTEDMTYNEPAEQPIRIGGKYFDDQGEAPISTETEVYNRETTNQEEQYVVYEDDYNSWGDDEGIEIEINNFYSPYSSFGWYRPFRPYRYYGWNRPFISFNFGWNYWGYRPFYSPFYGFSYPSYVGFHNPYYGFYAPYSPYYSPYYPSYHNHNNYGGYYRNEYIREVYRGRGNNNGISQRSVSNQRIENRQRNHTRRTVRQHSQSETRNTREGSTIQPRRTRTSIEHSSSSDNSPVRIRRRSRVSGEVKNSSSQIRTPRRSSSSIRSNKSVRTKRVTPNNSVRNQSPSYNSTPRSSTRRNTTINSSPRSRSSMGSSSSRRSSSSRSSGGRRR